LVDNIDDDSCRGPNVPAVIFLGSNNQNMLARLFVVEALGGEYFSGHWVNTEFVVGSLLYVVRYLGCGRIRVKGLK
jgi:hypothetical protein